MGDRAGPRDRPRRRGLRRHRLRRDAGFPDAEATLGLLINTVPVRVRLPRAEPIRAALRRVQSEAAALLEHRHAGRADVLRWSGQRELFDTLLVFESFPVDEDALHAAERAAGLDVTALAGESVTHYPLTLTVPPRHRAGPWSWSTARTCSPGTPRPGSATASWPCSPRS
ncbi:condensation domain-containing protein [Catenuloplanes niger]